MLQIACLARIGRCGLGRASSRESSRSHYGVIQATAEGQAAAANIGSSGWFAGGFASGVVLGLIGTGITWALAANSQVEVAPDKRLLISSRSATYQQLYEKAYGDKVKSKRKVSALTGGLLGTATILVVYLSAMASDGY